MSDVGDVAGIVKWVQVMAGEAQYEECRKLYTEEINAVVREFVYYEYCVCML